MKNDRYVAPARPLGEGGPPVVLTYRYPNRAETFAYFRKASSVGDGVDAPKPGEVLGSANVYEEAHRRRQEWHETVERIDISSAAAADLVVEVDIHGEPVVTGKSAVDALVAGDGRFIPLLSADGDVLFRVTTRRSDRRAPGDGATRDLGAGTERSEPHSAGATGGGAPALS